MKRDWTNPIRHVMDEWLPPVIRDNRWFMYPFFWIAYRGRNVGEVMDFKRRVHAFTAADYDRFYNSLNTISRNRATDLNRPSLEFILGHLDPAARTLIDVGSGNGYLLRAIHAARPELRLTGFDIRDSGERSPAYRFVRGNIERLPFPDRAFDVVTCCHTIEHLLRLERCIAELIRIARRQLILVTPCQRPYFYTLDEHVRFFPYREALTSVVPLANPVCEKRRGDWVYVGRLDGDGANARAPGAARERG